MPQYTDDELAERAKNGDPAAFGLLVEKYYKGLFNFLLRMLANREDAEDCLHETFLKAASAMKRYRAEGKFKSWIYTIANNTAISKIRKRKRGRAFFGQNAYRDAKEFPNPIDNLSDGKFEPAESAGNRELCLLLDKAVSSLPPQQRQVFLLKHESGLTFREISETLNIPLNTALGRMNYAMGKLRKILGDELF